MSFLFSEEKEALSGVLPDLLLWLSGTSEYEELISKMAFQVAENICQL